MRHQRWEYTTVIIDVKGWVSAKIDRDATTAELNRYGAEGWELVNTLAANEGYGRTSQIVAVFKRPRN